MCHVSGSVVLTEGRKTPGEGENVVRGEGVALVLSGLAVDDWKRGGSHAMVSMEFQSSLCKWGRGQQAGCMWRHATLQQELLAGKQRIPSTKR